MRRQKGNLAMVIDDYNHALEKRDYHKLLRRHGFEQGGIVTVRPHYEHYRGIAGFVQQSQPNTASVPKVLRQFMVPSSPTNALVSIDLAQADWNWLQALTLAPSMIAASKSGDVYRYVGSRLDLEGISLERQGLKRFVNSINYGRTASGLQREWNHRGYSYDAKAAIRAYRGMFPELAGFMTDVTKSRYPFVVDRFERHLNVGLTESQKAALPAQSGVAAFMKAFMVGVFEQRPSWIPVDMIRDMAIFEIPQSDVDKAESVAFAALDSAKATFEITKAFEGQSALHTQIIGG